MKIWVLLVTFIVGVALGATWPMFGKRYMTPYLPEFLKSPVHAVEGTVVRKQREPDRLLLTVSTTLGTTLATFKEKVAEVDLLIEQGDSVAFDLSQYQPFVHDPEIVRVTKKSASAPSSPREPASASMERPSSEASQNSPSPIVDQPPPIPESGSTTP